MKGEQTDLFDCPAVQGSALAPAQILRFPGDPLLPMIRRTARELDQVQGPAADLLWRERCQAMQRDLISRSSPSSALVTEIARRLRMSI